MEWIYITLNWYVYILVLGIIFFPLAQRLFGPFLDRGYGFSKTLAILFLSYASFIGGVYHLVGFTRINLFILLGLFVLINAYLFVSDRRNSKGAHHKGRHSMKIGKWDMSFVVVVIIEELLFLLGLFFLTYTRGMDPSIRGLEKFMDFGFMNSVLRSNYFPPLDIWLSADPTHPAGYPINYYYFGHLSGAMLIKLTGILPEIGYNLVLATICGQGATLAFSLIVNIIAAVQKYFLRRPIRLVRTVFYGIIGSIVLNVGGNLHTIYLFTQGYPNESPVPFWNIMSWYNPTKYWYPNATRFIPNTIHEFPAYSYVVADLHGHVFDIPFVMLTFGIVFMLFMRWKLKEKAKIELLTGQDVKPEKVEEQPSRSIAELPTHYVMYTSAFLGFMAAIHYMTNAFDGPIYVLFAGIIFFVLFKFSFDLVKATVVMLIAFLIFSHPFSAHFIPFVSGVALNCSPEFLVKIGKIGPFLFEKGKCQSSPLWMLFVLWGFYWISLVLHTVVLYFEKKAAEKKHEVAVYSEALSYIDSFILVVFIFGTYLIIVPEFFYIKDIYPDHFRANTMFKLGYQAFMMMSIAAIYVYYRISFIKGIKKYLLKAVFIVPLFLVLLYPFSAFPSYYGEYNKPVEMNGAKWFETTFPEDKEIIDYIQKNIKGQPNILEAQGDSYTDYERISAYTGLPTLAGWWVHEWLWRGSADVIGQRIPDVETIYNTQDPGEAIQVLNKYRISYVVVAPQERTRYPELSEDKFNVIGKKVFTTKSGLGALYKVEK